MKWIKIEGKKSLPKEKCNIVSFHIMSGKQQAGVFSPMPLEAYDTNYLINQCSHYYIIKDIPNPK